MGSCHSDDRRPRQPPSRQAEEAVCGSPSGNIEWREVRSLLETVGAAYSMGPPSSGGSTVGEALNILEGYPLSSLTRVDALSANVPRPRRGHRRTARSPQATLPPASAESDLTARDGESGRLCIKLATAPTAVTATSRRASDPAPPPPTQGTRRTGGIKGGSETGRDRPRCRRRSERRIGLVSRKNQTHRDRPRSTRAT
jgi:hypothetical protein